VDLKGARIWNPAKLALENSIGNVAFLRSRIEEITDYLPPRSVDEIWITFPDPYPRPCKARKRLTAPRFLDLYRQILKPGHRVHLKTDHDGLFEFSLQTIPEHEGHIHERIDDLYERPPDREELAIQPTFEREHLALGRTIKYLSFSLTLPSLPAGDQGSRHGRSGRP
jgi:tRNA (guanine-N7-)-methyltransferase